MTANSRDRGGEPASIARRFSWPARGVCVAVLVFASTLKVSRGDAPPEVLPIPSCRVEAVGVLTSNPAYVEHRETISFSSTSYHVGKDSLLSLSTDGGTTLLALNNVVTGTTQYWATEKNELFGSYSSNFMQEEPYLMSPLAPVADIVDLLTRKPSDRRFSYEDQADGSVVATIDPPDTVIPGGTGCYITSIRSTVKEGRILSTEIWNDFYPMKKGERIGENRGKTLSSIRLYSEFRKEYPALPRAIHNETYGYQDGRRVLLTTYDISVDSIQEIPASTDLDALASRLGGNLGRVLATKADLTQPRRASLLSSANVTLLLAGVGILLLFGSVVGILVRVVSKKGS